MRIVDWVRKKVWKKSAEESPYHDLAPVDDIEEETEYFRALDWALQNRKISNVALSAPYGAGKSSVIESYLKKRKIKALQLSLTNFQEEQHDLTQDEVEKQFLEKLFYKVEYRKIPQSRYRKLHRISLGRIYGYLVLLFVVMLGFTTAFNYPGVHNVIRELNQTRSTLKMPLFLGVSALLGLVVLAVYLLSYIIKFVAAKCRNWEINVLDKAKVSKSDALEAPALNKYIDEIIYFFEETDYEVVFVEDLDRFSSTGIFTKLRELNILLNRYDSIKRHITFVYAMKDDYFPTDVDRTKFFDFIIPVIPYINSTNSDDLLRRRIKEINNLGMATDIGDEYITKVSSYVSDMRVLTSIVNEFVTYKNTISLASSLSDEVLFSLMVFKHLYPKEFADIESEKGVIKEAFLCKESFVDKKIKEMQVAIEAAEKILDKQEEDILIDVKEIKVAMFQTIALNASIQNVVMSQTGMRYSFDSILAADFDMTVFANAKFVIQGLKSNGGSFTIPVVDVEREYTKNGVGYIQRWRNAYACEGEKAESLRKQIEEKKNKQYRLTAARIKSLINEFGAEALFGDSAEVSNNKLLIFLLRNGYIDENYANYINHFHPDSITSDEHEFIMNVHNQGGVKEFSKEFSHLDRVVGRIVAHEFRQVEILNFSIVNYMLSEQLESEKTKELFALLASRKSETRAFIEQFILSGAETVPVFISGIANQNAFLWSDILTDKTLTDDAKARCFDLILSTSTLKSIEQMNDKQNSISVFLLGRRDILLSLEKSDSDKIINVLAILDIRFTDVALAGVSADIISYIYEKNAYMINKTMISEIMRAVMPDEFDRAQKQNYTVVMTSDNGYMRNYIKQNPERYIEEIVIADGNDEETQEAMLELFAVVGYDVPLSEKIISAQKTVFVSLEELIADIDNSNKSLIHEIVDFLIAQEKLIINWKNVGQYYEYFDIEDEMFLAIDKNLDDLCKEKKEVDEELIKSLLIKKWPLEHFRKFVNTYRIESPDIDMTELDEDHIKLLIEARYLPFSLDTVVDVYDSHPEAASVFFENYKNEIFDVLPDIPVEKIPCEKLMESNEYTENEKYAILERCGSSVMSRSIAEFIMNYKNDVAKEFILAAWGVLEIEQKYKLLRNHIDSLDNDDLPKLFSQLDKPYQLLAERTNHKVVFEDSSYNKWLLEKLKEKDYLTSVGVENATYSANRHLYTSSKSPRLFCRVKESR